MSDIVPIAVIMETAKVELQKWNNLFWGEMRMNLFAKISIRKTERKLNWNPTSYIAVGELIRIISADAKSAFREEFLRYNICASITNPIINVDLITEIERPEIKANAMIANKVSIRRIRLFPK